MKAPGQFDSRFRLKQYETRPLQEGGFSSYLFTSGQAEADSGWNALSPGIVATSL
jgi:hypothetical protein